MGYHKARLLAIALTLLPITYAGHDIPSPFRRHQLKHKRQNGLTIPNPLPSPWTALGCITDNNPVRSLAGPSEAGDAAMTIQVCLAFCSGFIFAGVEFGDECYCANTLTPGTENATATDCDMPCAANANEPCGAGNRLNLFWNGTAPPPPPAVVPSVGDWVSQGCYSDNVNGRALPNGVNTNPNTIETCTAACFAAGFPLAGAEYAAQCYCGTAIGNGGAPIAASSCDMECSGNPSEFCGGPNALNVYMYTGTGLSSGGSGGSGGVGPVTSGLPTGWSYNGCWVDNADGRILSTTIPGNPDDTNEVCIAACVAQGFSIAGTEFSDECYCGNTLVGGAVLASASSDCAMPCAGNAAEACGGPNLVSVYASVAVTVTGGGGGGGGGGTGGTVSPVTTGLPTGWAYKGCWVDNAFGRILITELPDDPTTTPATCIANCVAQNYTLAGIEFADQCFCGDTLVDGAVLASADSDCNMGCAGDASEACGGPNLVSLYASVPVVALPVPVAMTTDLPGDWSYAGCLREPTNGTRMFPYMNTWTTNNSALACMNQCATYGYTAAGVEFGIQCFCGDVGDVVVNDGVFGAESECALACPGDPIHLCGDGNRLNTYYWNGSSLSNWKTPANTGYYEFLVPGVIIPLIATVGINSKVTFLEKWGTGPPNSTGAYELDLSLVNDFDLAWRAMHVQTDVFCSGAIILPDIGGRVINVGGWSLDSTFGIRLYTPDGSAGVNGTNDWEENFEELSLQVGRWYPSAAMLPNGTVLVIGGETGSNASPQPNLETLPRPPGGPTTVFLDWLNRTDPYNLYPFVIVLPSANLFVGYYNEARILEPVTFTTINQLPNIPGAVNNFLAGRTYPLEGTAVPLPQFAPYTDPLEILICGGSTIGAAIALDNCVTIAPEASNPTWTIERMPSQRVMTCISALPDGTYLILNGAQQGVAGFGLATNPNLGAVLYDPTQPIGSRMSILNTTIVARLYHSEATLLPDGRVLISGSDPETDFANGTAEYPQEYRIEAYYPPYLTQGFIQPNYTLPVNDWAYGQTYQITNVVLHQGSAMRVSLIAATASTHGNAMGARTIFPAFSCSGSTCTITAPPNSGVSPPGWHQLFILDGPTPSHSQWVRIGGDPSKLGLWPNLPGFTPPGL